MRKKTWIIILLCIFLLFFWAVWNAFLSSFIPRHRTSFENYESFRKKAEESGLTLQLPESACDIKYYWGVDWFVTVAGYGASLSDEDYEDIKQQTIISYQENFKRFSGVTLYYSETGEKNELQKAWLEDYNIEETERLFLENEEIEDYYILAYAYNDSRDSVTYFNSMLCNDSSKRIVEISCIDRNAKARKK